MPQRPPAIVLYVSFPFYRNNDKIVLTGHKGGGFCDGEKSSVGGSASAAVGFSDGSGLRQQGAVRQFVPDGVSGACLRLGEKYGGNAGDLVNLSGDGAKLYCKGL